MHSGIVVSFHVPLVYVKTVWASKLYGTNLFDKRYVTGINNITASTFGTPIASVYPPRRYGIDLHAAHQRHGRRRD